MCGFVWAGTEVVPSQVLCWMWECGRKGKTLLTWEILATHLMLHSKICISNYTRQQTARIERVSWHLIKVKADQSTPTKKWSGFMSWLLQWAAAHCNNHDIKPWHKLTLSLSPLWIGATVPWDIMAPKIRTINLSSLRSSTFEWEGGFSGSCPLLQILSLVHCAFQWHRGYAPTRETQI